MQQQTSYTTAMDRQLSFSTPVIDTSCYGRLFIRCRRSRYYNVVSMGQNPNSQNRTVHWGSWLPPNRPTRFLRPIRVQSPNSTSIGLSVYVRAHGCFQQTYRPRYSVHAMRSLFISKQAYPSALAWAVGCKTRGQIRQMTSDKVTDVATETEPVSSVTSLRRSTLSISVFFYTRTNWPMSHATPLVIHKH